MGFGGVGTKVLNDVETTTTVRELKQMIIERSGGDVGMAWVHLIHQGKIFGGTFDLNKTLACMNIQGGSMVHAQLRPHRLLGGTRRCV